MTTPWHAISSLLVLLLGCLLCIKLNRWLQVSQRMIVLLYFWHTLFCLIYIYFSVNFETDAWGYFVIGGENLPPFALGTTVIYWLVSFFLLFDLSFFGVSLCFNIIGAIGLIFFYASLKKVVRFSSRKIQRIVLMIVFLPSVSFWSAAIGKDSISFLCISMALWAVTNFKDKKTLLFFSILVIFLVRPHIAIIMLVSLVASVIFQRSTSIFQKILLGSSAMMALYALIPVLLTYVGLESDFDTSVVISYVETREGQNMYGGGAIDLSSMSFVEKLFTYLFRPLPFEAKGILQLAASLDNVFLLYLLMLGFFAVLKLNFHQSSENRMFMWVFVILTWTMLSLTTANLGIMVRQKWMFCPFIIYLLISKLAFIERPQIEYKAQRRNQS